MPSPKQERAYAIVAHILEEDRKRPRVDPCSALPGRFVGDHRGLLATMTLGHRFNVGPVYGATRTGRRPIEASDWTAITISDRGIPLFAANVCGVTVHITFYTPGPWECAYGVDWEGDDQRFQWGDPPIGDDLEGQNRVREKDLNLKPLRTPPPAVDALRAAVMCQRSKPRPRSDSLTVFLQDNPFLK